MENEHPYPPCPSCGASDFVSLPELAFEAHRSTSVLGMAAVSRVGFWRATLVICAACGRTDVFSKNTGEIAQSVPGAMTFRGVPR